VTRVDTVTPPAQDFYRRWVRGNSYLGERAALLARWLDDDTDRAEIAAALGVPLGSLLRSFNDTAPVGAPIPFRYRGIGFAVTGMAGVCDDIVGDRFPRFGAPITLRCYLTDTDLLPQRLHELADWNFMDAGRDGFLGYGYGVRYERTAYLAGLQSDLAARYTYLFQGRGAGTDVRVGERVEYRAAADLAAAYGPYVPALRRTFQRYWIDILLAATLTWARTAAPELADLGLLQFPLEPAEAVPGHVVHRVYRGLPDRLGWLTRRVRLPAGERVYRTATLPAIAHSLRDRLRC
jgi:hypothetical protein